MMYRNPGQLCVIVATEISMILRHFSTFLGESFINGRLLFTTGPIMQFGETLNP